MKVFSPSILVLDETTESFEIVQEQARLAGYDAEIEHVICPDNFQKSFERRHWDVVVTEYSIGQCTAYDILALINKSERDSAMVILSEDIPEDESFDTIYAGACDFIYKDKPERLMPVIFRETRAHIKNLHHQRLQRAVGSFGDSLRESNPDLYARFHATMEEGNKDLVDTFDHQEALGALEQLGHLDNKYYEIIRQTKFMQYIPIHMAERAFAALKEKTVKKGDVIMQMGKEVNEFYIIVEGSAEKRELDMDTGGFDQTRMITVGDEIGYEPILQESVAERNATMTTDGILLSLEKEVFQELVATPLVNEVEVPIAKAMLDNGYGLIDVRLDEEYEMKRIPGATLIPLHEVKKRMGEIVKGPKYVVCCRSGSRSAAATYIFAKAGYNVTNMAGGMLAWTYETESDY